MTMMESWMGCNAARLLLVLTWFLSCLLRFSHGLLLNQKKHQLLRTDNGRQQSLLFSAPSSLSSFQAPGCNASTTSSIANDPYSSQQEANNASGRSKEKGPSIHPKRQRPRLPVLVYQDRWVCINKPASMTVHRSHRQSKFELVVSTSLKRQLRRKVWTVHRLDHRTSGALLFAFDAETCAKLHSALRHDDSTKLYVALLRGNWYNHFGANTTTTSTTTTTTTINQPVSVDGVLKDATTVFTCLAVQDNGQTLPCSLVTAQLRTGRRHQIRRHAFFMGMPVLGDSQHGSSRHNRWWRNNMNLHRLALHCLYLDLPDWQDGCNNKRIRIVAPLTQDLRSVLQQEKLAELWEQACENEPRLDTPFIDIRTGTLGVKKDWQRQNLDDDTIENDK